MLHVLYNTVNHWTMPGKIPHIQCSTKRPPQADSYFVLIQSTWIQPVEGNVSNGYVIRDMNPGIFTVFSLGQQDITTRY